MTWSAKFFGDLTWDQYDPWLLNGTARTRAAGYKPGKCPQAKQFIVTPDVLKANFKNPYIANEYKAVGPPGDPSDS